ncbi:hypothetical protein QGM71_17795 [Virgibacillus sp. C22-A2]|uniref:Uncharacterized protein n=1 Tax=Virgibacillus tibetensis TaxID=3042313 RepID=A0ABU6KJ36_9BACI|nr:hypothetical protein [Virgibacillus sp. C22-A2]
MRKNRFLFATIIGVIGSLMGLYIWKDYLPEFSGDTIEDWIWILRMKYVIFLYIPSCLALVAVVFRKTHLMLLAFLINLPVVRYIGVEPLIIPDTLPLVYYPLVCYLISTILMINVSSKKNS